MNGRRVYETSLLRCIAERIFRNPVYGGYGIPRPLRAGEVRELYHALLGPDGDRYECTLLTSEGRGFADAGAQEETLEFQITPSNAGPDNRGAAYIKGSDNGFTDGDGDPFIFQLFLSVSEEYRVFKTLERMFETEDRR